MGGWKPTGGGASPLTTKGDVHTYDTVDARLAVGANDTVLTADSAQSKGVKWATPAAGGDPYGHLPSSPGTYDDEFNDRSLHGDWTTITTSGSQTIIEDLGRLSVTYDDQTAGDMNGVLKAMTLNTGDYIRCGLKQMTAAAHAGNWDQVGLWFTDGTAASSNMIALVVYTPSFRFSIFEGTITSWAEVSASTYDRTLPLGDVHIEMEYGAANSFDARIGPDGVSFLDNVLANTFTLTPTYGGLCWTTHGGADPKVVSYDYFRSNA